MNSSPPTACPVVLIVEDEWLVRDLAAEEFRSCGFDVVEFETAELAARYMEDEHDEVVGVFTDINTPGSIDGLDLAAFIWRRWPSIAVLVTSGGNRVSRQNFPPSAGFIQKPWHPSDVVARLRALSVPPEAGHAPRLG